MTGGDIAARALSFVGLRETAPNRGPEIDRWLAEAHVEPGDPWCASFATSSDVWGDALPPGFPLASALKLKAWAEGHGALVRSGRLLAGDLFVILHGDGSGSGHVGVVLGDNGDGTCATCEGNEGNQVRVRMRSGGEFAAVVRAAD